MGFLSAASKESLGEYGSGWEWDNNTYAHVFDQTNSEGIPYRLSNNGTSFDVLKDFCINEVEVTNGQILHSGHVYTYQTSCKANTGNAGNYYSWPTATAGSSISTGNASNSVCPRGWQLTVNTETEVKSWYYLIRKTYGILDKNDSKIRPHPLSISRSGQYSSLDRRGAWSFHWSATANSINNAYELHITINANNLDPQASSGKSNGLSVRCVAC